MSNDPQTTISVFSADDLARHVPDLGALLHACVHDGANIGFVLPFTEADSEAFWRNKVLPAVQGGARVMLVAHMVAHMGGRIAGSVQLDRDTLPNQPHRAEVSKLLVHPDFRRLGIARALMADIERRAIQLGRSLITLDTRTGDTAESLYTSMGYESSGVIPGYCRDPKEDRFYPTTIMYKVL